MTRLLAVWGAVALLIPSASSGQEVWFEQEGKRFRVLSDSPAAGAISAELEAFAEALEQRSADLRLQPTAPFEIVAIASAELWSALTANHPAAHRASGLHLSRADASWLLLDVGPSRAAEALRTARHELTHHVMALNLPPLPLALAEGLAEYYAMTETGDSPRFGGAIPAWQRLVAGPRDLELDLLLGAEAADPDYTDADRAAWFYARSWALVHWLLEDGSLPPDAAGNLIAALSAGTSPSAALEQATGHAAREIERRVRAHVVDLPAPATSAPAVQGGDSSRLRSPLGAKRRIAVLASLLGARRMGLDLAQESWIGAPAQAEAGGTLAELLAHEQRLDEADPLWLDAWERGLADPRLLVGLARRRIELRDLGLARAALGRALDHHPRYAEAMALLVRCDLGESRVDRSTLTTIRAARELLAFRVDLIQLEATVRSILGQAAEARRLIEHDLTALAPDQVVATRRAVDRHTHLHRGFEHWRKGNLAETKIAWEHALALSDDPAEHEGLRRSLLQIEAALEGADP